MSQRKPDIIVIMADQLRYDCLSAAGHPTVKTPALDRLCTDGTRFAQCYTTSPVCMPARSSFASGIFTHNHGQWSNYSSLREDAPTYMKALRNSGYHTAHIGKSHLYAHAGQHLNTHIPFMNELGFNDVLETTGPWATVETDSIMTDHWEQKGILELFRNDYKKRRQTDSLKAIWPSPMPEGECIDDFIGKTAIRYINGYEEEQPLCAFIGFGGPHEPWDPSKKWAEMYAQAETPEPLPAPEYPAYLNEAAKTYQETICDRTPTTEEAQAIRRLYYAKISQVDHWINEIIEALEKRGNMDNTFILFWSDHGERLADRGGIFKCAFYDDSARVPLIIRKPGGKGAGQISQTLCSTVDMTATICEAAGVETVGMGKSLLPVTENPAITINDYVFGEIDHKGYRTTMIRDERYKMVIDSSNNTLQLFDMVDDINEMHNLAGNSSYAEVETRLRLLLLEWKLKTENCCA